MYNKDLQCVEYSNLLRVPSNLILVTTQSGYYQLLFTCKIVTEAQGRLPKATQLVSTEASL